MNKMNDKDMFRYNVRTICCVIDSVNAATGETVRIRTKSFINLLENDPFLSPIFDHIFQLRPYYRLRMTTDDLYPSIDMPEEPVAQIIFVLNFMYDCAKRPSRSIFDLIFAIYGSGNETGDFIEHVLRAPLALLKARLLQLLAFSWEEIKDNLSEILFPNYVYRFLTPDSLPQEHCINMDRILFYFRKARIDKEKMSFLLKDIDLYIKNHNSYNPDIFFIKEFLSHVVRHGGRMALSAILCASSSSLIIPHILDADPAAATLRKRGRKPGKTAATDQTSSAMCKTVQTS